MKYETFLPSGPFFKNWAYHGYGMGISMEGFLSITKTNRSEQHE